MPLLCVCARREQKSLKKETVLTIIFSFFLFAL